MMPPFASIYSAFEYFRFKNPVVPSSFTFVPSKTTAPSRIHGLSGSLVNKVPLPTNKISVASSILTDV